MNNRLLAWTDEAWDDYVYWQTQAGFTQLDKIRPPDPPNLGEILLGGNCVSHIKIRKPLKESIN